MTLPSANIIIADLNHIIDQFFKKNNEKIVLLIDDFQEIFGKEKAYQIPISSVKPIIGHCMGGTGSLEALACILAIRDQKVAPTINYQNPDPECDLDYVPNEARSCDIDIALSTSAGLGGHNASLLFKRI